MSEKVKAVRIVRLGAEKLSSANDLLVVEEPLEIRVGYGSSTNRQQDTLTVTMRTPGDDEHLCLGFLFTEGIINSVNEVLSAKYCSNITEGDGGNNVMRVELIPEKGFNPADFKRNFYTTSSCGVCGKASIDHLRGNCEPLIKKTKVSKHLFNSLPNILLAQQDVFKHTGGVHACGLFDLEGQLIIHKEDVGRHNALDKLIGSLLISNSIPLTEKILLLSGRISFELVQKAILAGIEIVAAVGAPSSLATELADEFGVTLIGFVKEEGFNIYTSSERIID